MERKAQSTEATASRYRRRFYSYPLARLAIALSFFATPSILAEPSGASTHQAEDEKNPESPSLFTKATEVQESLVAYNRTIVDIRKEALTATSFNLEDRNGILHEVSIQDTAFVYGHTVLVGTTKEGFDVSLSFNHKTGTVAGHARVSPDEVMTIHPLSQFQSALSQGKIDRNLPPDQHLPRHSLLDRNTLIQAEAEAVGTDTKVDLFVGYTAGTLKQGGNLTHEEIDHLIAIEVALGNIAHANSGSPVRDVLVGTHYASGFQEPTNDNATILYLQELNDGILDDLTNAAATKHADITILLDGPPNSGSDPLEICGNAWRLTAEDLLDENGEDEATFLHYAFAVVHIQCTEQNSNKTFRHERGHQQGGKHSVHDEGFTVDQIAPDVFGFISDRTPISTDTEVKDIMSYDTHNPFAVEHNLYSSEVLINGTTMIGKPGEANLARAFGVGLPIVANLRPSIAPDYHLAFDNPNSKLVIKGDQTEIRLEGSYDTATPVSDVYVSINWGEPVLATVQNGRWNLPIDISEYEGRIYVGLFGQDGLSGASTYIDLVKANSRVTGEVNTNRITDGKVTEVKNILTNILVRNQDGTITDSVVVSSGSPFQVWSTPGAVTLLAQQFNRALSPVFCYNATTPVNAPTQNAELTATCVIARKTFVPSIRSTAPIQSEILYTEK